MLKLNKKILKTVNHARRHCLWQKQDKDHHNSLAAWEIVCRPKDKRGLGIVNLEIQNDAFLLKHLFKIFNHANTSWVHMTWQAYYQNVMPQAAHRAGSFWWRDVCNLMTHFRGITTFFFQNGEFPASASIDAHSRFIKDGSRVVQVSYNQRDGNS
jgi:hypothetical protein